VRRSLLTILTVTLLASGIARFERARGVTSVPSPWVRTSAGWEPRAAVELAPTTERTVVHPLLAGLLMGGAAVLALLALPTASAVPQPAASPSAAPASSPLAGPTSRRKKRLVSANN
jgi:hypothetical protein